MDVEIVTLAQRPDAEPLANLLSIGWPEFMKWDPVAPCYYSVAHQHFAEYVLVALDPTAPPPGRALARAYSAPFAWTEPDLPVDGWDRVLQRAIVDRMLGATPNLVSAVEVCVDPAVRGSGLSGLMLAAMRDNARRLGFDTLVAPVRPSAKHTVPDQPMHRYAYATRPDGLPVDPWLRVHVRAGGRIESIATRSMTIIGTLAEWRTWTSLPFDTSGPVYVPEALVPVQCDLKHDYAAYVEPNVWVRHQL